MPPFRLTAPLLLLTMVGCDHVDHLTESSAHSGDASEETMTQVEEAESDANEGQLGGDHPHESEEPELEEGEEEPNDSEDSDHHFIHHVTEAPIAAESIDGVVWNDDDDTDGTDGTTDTPEDDGTEPIEPCASNTLEVQGSDGMPLATFSRFVFHDDGDSIWVMGFESGDSSDACEWAADLTLAAGYTMSIELTGDRVDGTEKTWMDDDNVANAAELRIENGGSTFDIEAENDSGTLVMGAYTAGQSLVLTGISGELEDGSTIDDGTITACYCGDMAFD